MKLKKQNVSLNFKLTTTVLFFILISIALLSVIFFVPKNIQATNPVEGEDVVARSLDVEWLAVYCMTLPVYPSTVVEIEGILMGDTDDVDLVEVEYKTSVLGTWKSIGASHLGGDYYRGYIQPTEFNPGDTVYYRMVAHGLGFTSVTSFEQSFYVNGPDASLDIEEVWYVPDPATTSDIITVKATISGEAGIAMAKVTDQSSGSEYAMNEGMFSWSAEIGTLPTSRWVTVTAISDVAVQYTKDDYITITDESPPDPTDTTPPTISNIIHSPSPTYELNDIFISASISDDSGVEYALCYYKTGILGSWTDLLMSSSGNLYSINIGSFSPGTNVYYKITAIDVYANEVTSDTYSFEVLEIDSTDTTTTDTTTTTTTDTTTTTTTTDPTTPPTTPPPTDPPDITNIGISTKAGIGSLAALGLIGLITIIALRRRNK